MIKSMIVLHNMNPTWFEALPTWAQIVISFTIALAIFLFIIWIWFRAWKNPGW